MQIKHYEKKNDNLDIRGYIVTEYVYFHWHIMVSHCRKAKSLFLLQQNKFLIQVQMQDKYRYWPIS